MRNWWGNSKEHSPPSSGSKIHAATLVATERRLDDTFKVKTHIFGPHYGNFQKLFLALLLSPLKSFPLKIYKILKLKVHKIFYKYDLINILQINANNKKTNGEM